MRLLQCAVLPEPLLLVHTNLRCRQSIRLKYRHLVPQDSLAWSEASLNLKVRTLMLNRLNVYKQRRPINL